MANQTVQGLAVFVPVRLGSSRLPGKALLDLGGRPVLATLVERLRAASRPSRVVICTTDRPEDDSVETLARASGADVFRGSEVDLLARFHAAAQLFGVAHIVNVDGDDILTDPEQVDQVAEVLVSERADWVRLEGLPFGAAPIGLTAAALARVCAEKTTMDTATGWGKWFQDRTDLRVVIRRIADPALVAPELRLTLDYPEDLRVFQAIYAELSQPGVIVPLRDVISLMRRRPDLAAVNASLEEKYWSHFRGAGA
jgi:spore coat polysaccharide biosynthesis protein SpsF